MNFDKIKNLVKQNGDKFVFVENGEPEVVMMSFQEYQKLAQSGQNNQMHQHATQTIRTHPNITNEDLEHSADNSDSSGRLPPYEGAGLPLRLEDIRLEDLPV